MTSGSPAVVAGVETEASDVMKAVRSEIELIRYAADKPDWSSPSARTRFNMTAWTTRASAEVAFIRLNRATLSLAQATDAYRSMESAATAVIEHWRRWKGRVTDPISLLLLRAAVLVELASIRDQYGARLDEARDFVEADPLTDEQRDWLTNGLVRSMRRDLETPTDPGPVIPDTLATGDDDGGWTPQGLGYDPASGLLVQTSYAGSQSHLTLVDPDTGETVASVDLGAYEGAAPDHAGGVAVHDGLVWVTSSGDPAQVYSYSMAEIASAAPGQTVPVHGVPQAVGGGAYSTIVGGTLYVGTFAHGPGRLYTYTWDATSGSWGDEQGPFATPPEVQGIAVRGGEVVFSSSWGRDNGSRLLSYDLADVLSGGDLGDPLRSVDLPNMSEGIAMLPQGVLSTYESGAAGYVDPKGGPLEELWAAMNMTVTPYASLGLAGLGIDVEPLTLKQASRLFDEVERGLEGAERRIAGLTLPAGCLGDAPEAAAYVHAIGHHCHTTASWLGQGKLSSGVTASGLIASAAGYEETDSSSGGLFDRLLGLLP
jgi:hypothetical protein